MNASVVFREDDDEEGGWRKAETNSSRMKIYVHLSRDWTLSSSASEKQQRMASEGENEKKNAWPG